MGRYLIIILIIMGFAFAANLIINGDFEQELDIGWEQSAYGAGYYIIVRNTALHTDPDYEGEVYISQRNGDAKLYQIIDISSTDIEFSCDAKLYAYDNNATDWSAAAVILAYMDASNTVLGETRIYQYSPGCPWTSSPTRHLILAPDTDWNHYSFNINDELTTNLTGINPVEVAKIQVALYDTAKYCYG